MGLSISKLFEGKEIRTLMLGLDAAGKTTILYKLKFGQVVTTIPYIGFQVETLEYKNIRFSVWDLGGCHRYIIQYTKHYYENAQCLIFVVDSSDKERIEIAKDELMRTLQLEELTDIPLLILANKQDLNVMDVKEVTQKLELVKLNRVWHIQGVCALTADGLYEGLEWLTKTIKQKK